VQSFLGENLIIFWRSLSENTSLEVCTWDQCFKEDCAWVAVCWQHII